MIKLNKDDFKTNSSPKPIYIDKGIPVSLANFVKPTDETNEKPKEIKIFHESAAGLPYPKETEPNQEESEPMAYKEGGGYKIPEGVNKPQPITDSYPGKVTFLLIMIGIIALLIAFSLKD